MNIINAKFKTGDAINVAKILDTKITKVEYSKKDKGFLYYFKDRDNKEFCSLEKFVTLIPRKEHYHTPGPWQIGTSSKKLQKYIVGNNCKIAKINKLKAVSEKEAMANAILIKHAPELLKIAEMYHDSLLSKNNSIAFQVVNKLLNKIKDEQFL